jgi:hypothetical protein
MYILLIVATFFVSTTIISAIALIFVYPVTLSPRNAMQNYTATPEECIPKTLVALSASIGQ